MKPIVKAFFHENTFTVTYIVAESNGPHCVIVDSVLDYDHRSGRTSTSAANQIIAYVKEKYLLVDWILETHVHADHLTAAPYLQQTLGGRIGVAKQITGVQEVFKDVFNVEADFATDGSQFDHLFADEESFQVGDLSARVMHTPGHTPACATYVFDDAAFVGDTLFMPDYGTARTDFPGGDAATLYRSIQKILALPDNTRLFMCHDYKAPGRDDYAWETTVAEQRADNIHIGRGITEREFVSMRTERDKSLDMPALILPSVQVNIRAGHMPPTESNGVSFLKIPVNTL